MACPAFPALNVQREAAPPTEDMIRSREQCQGSRVAGEGCFHSDPFCKILHANRE